ncbi:MAG TPA: heavy metal-binding domain-containing protein [Gemmatimonadetes bacterium]|nr:heavy metal-binding domain-containing protein [Gemmatimonadota bacterium]
MDVLSYFITPLMLWGAWISGGILERRHLKGLLLLESGSREVLAITIEDLPPDWHVESCELVMGNVVISQDYFKRFAASIKGIFGGNIGVFEPLLERARREALIRMKGVAHARGYHTIINVRLETTTLARSRPDGKGTAGVEILAYGTAITLSEAWRALPGGGGASARPFA